MSESAPKTSRVGLVLIDDNPGFQAALADHLSGYADLSLLAKVGSGGEVLALPAALEPDVVLLDMHLPDRFGLDLIAPLLEKWPRAKVIVLTFDDYPRMRQRAIAAGAAAFVSKIDAATELEPAIRNALRPSNGESPWQTETGTSSGY